MAELICTINEFHKFIGPKIRNNIQAMTKRKKAELNHVCQECKQTRELEAAHIKGNSRRDIIDKILSKYIIDKEKGMIRVNLEKVESEIMDAHKPIEKYVKFLCAKCHQRYDSSVTSSTTSS